MTKLSERVRPGCEAAPWVIEEIKRLETATTTDCHACALADEMIASRDARIAELEIQLSGNPGEFAAPAPSQEPTK